MMLAYPMHRWAPVWFTALLGLLFSFARSDEPLYQGLVTRGIEATDGKRWTLPVPTLKDGMTGERQREALSEIMSKVGEDRFLKDSPVSPFVLEIKQLEKLDQGSLQSVDVWFAAYGTIDQILDRKLFDDLMIAQKPVGDDLPEESRELTKEELARFGLDREPDSTGSSTSYGVVSTTLFDKVRLSLATRLRQKRNADGFVQVSELVNDRAELPCVWSPITKEDTKWILGEPQRYSVAASYTKVTELKFVPRGLLVEMHTLFLEPDGWFHGRNLIRSKLPPAIQDGLRKFRRRLSHDDASDSKQGTQESPE